MNPAAISSRVRRRTRRRSHHTLTNTTPTEATQAEPHGSDLAVTWRDPGELRPARRNARTHSARQIERIAGSIEAFGFNNPILIDGDGEILAGHGRVEAARRLGLRQVPTITVEHLSIAQKRAYVLADNRLAELAGWDDETLALELGELAELDLGGELEFELETIGFETAEIDLILAQDEAQDPDGQDAEADTWTAPEGPTVTAEGDLWGLGEHRLLCGDALDPRNYWDLMGDELARMVFTDPPYNVPIQGHVCGLGTVRHREFAMASGEMDEAEFTRFLRTALFALAGACVDGALLYVTMDWRHLYELLGAARSSDLRMVNLCVWNKDNAGMGSLYRSKHELVTVLKKGRASHRNNVELGRHGRYRTNVWDYAGVNTLRRGRMEDLRAHPTVKPVALVADAIRDCTARGEIVLDGFGGAGTTILAAQKCGRRARMLELDPAYVDVAVRRWQRLSGCEAILERTGQSFTERAEQAAGQEGERGESGPEEARDV